MTHGSFFSGILGFDIAATRAGWQNVFTCEKDDFLRSFINFSSPNTYNHGDIKTFPSEKFAGAIDVISGGDPCQPHSVSGKRRGKGDDRYLWPEMFKAIEVIRPSWIVNENVIGTISNLVLDQKIADLESIGYSCQAFVIPALAIDADHQRKRVFLIANAEGKRLQAVRLHNENSKEQRRAQEQEWSINNRVVNGLHDLRPCHTAEFEQRMDQPAITTSKDGLPYSVDNRFLKAAGNLVAPGLAFIFFSIINEVEKTWQKYYQ